MKKLEETLNQVKSKKEEIKPVAEKPVYRGLQLIENREYQGPTSIKYWM